MSDQIQARGEIKRSDAVGQLLRGVDGKRSVRLQEFWVRIANTPNPQWYSGLRESDYMVLEVTSSQQMAAKWPDRL